MTPEKARIPYFDFLRGIAILLVVSILSFLQKNGLIWGWFIDTAVVLLSTAFIIHLLNKILPSKIIKYLGFR